MNEYVTYENLKDFLKIDSTDIADDTLLKGFCTEASRLFDAETHRIFYPLIATKYWDHPRDDDTRLMLGEDLLAVSVFTTQNGDVTITAAQYFVMCGADYNLTPYDRIVLKSDGSRPNLLYSGTIQQANAVTGTWGYHEDWANAWQDSNDTVQDTGGINASVTTVTVTDVDGADIYGFTPRFKVQQTIQIDSEWLYITGKNTSTNALTVRRGINGSTAAAHDKSTSITIYQPAWDVVQATKRLAAWLYGQKDQPYTERVQAAQAGLIVIPEAAPPDVKRVALRYKRRSLL